jgi:membrane-associated phospholipid phosphatase
MLLCVTFASPKVLAEDQPAAKNQSVEEAVAQHRLYWSDEWSPFPRYAELLLTGASAVAAVGAFTLVPNPTRTRWLGGILFDDAARDALRARKPGLRDAIRTASDLTLITSVLQVGLIDGLLIPLLDASPDVAVELTMINAQAFAINLAVSTLINKTVGRARPPTADCRRDSHFDPLCNTGTNASFPSSHTSTAFTAAGLTCVHHAYLPIYGGGWDTAACVESLAVAAATGLFRVAGDRHYATDVIAGAAIGFSIGYLYPWLMYYRSKTGGYRASTRDSHFAVLPAPPYGIALSYTH